jgi:hypothetical protein
MRQRPFGIAGCWQQPPVLVCAPHRGDVRAKVIPVCQVDGERMGFFGESDSMPYPTPTFGTAGWTLPTMA